MNIVLLSGGSGKRLWPLSNEVRSKQFIKILRNPNGDLESMLMRVHRQILDVDKNANIVVATSSIQLPSIINQLGSDISVSIEPYRRDTFPAIVLSSMFLKYKKNINDDEIIVFCPVDPYVENSFFEKIKELNDIMKNSDCNIGLIGIKPTYPSEKYGYIVCDNNSKNKNDKFDSHKNNFYSVDSFVEKPNLDVAKKLVDSKALWNAGVFAFKLSYIDEIAHKLIDFVDYDDLYSKYESLDKISFDYAVVEKEKNIKVLSYNGMWKDIGTWNTLTETTNEKIIGNAIIDQKSTNTNIINELDIPIIAMGLNNVVVAASPDGIFVSDKAESSYNKPMVEKINLRPMYEERAWGNFKILEMFDGELNDNNNKNIKTLSKHLYIKKDCNISYQKHNHRTEIWIIISGKGYFLLNDSISEVKCGDVLKINVGDKHSIRGITDLHFIEVQIGTELLESDIERYEYKWN